MRKANYQICVTSLGTGLPCGLVVTTAATADAEVVKLHADLKGSNEVPPNSSSGSGKVTFAGLTGPAIGAHFHGPSETGKNAGIALPFKAVQSPIQGTAALTESQATDLLAGKWYANIHTTMNPGGELRGQMMK
jgi:hypothetical protein